MIKNEKRGAGIAVVPVDKSGGLFALGARLMATATRPNGSSATFTLTNNPL